MRKIYILFTNTQTIMSRLVTLFKHPQYTHTSISLDVSNKDFYSFTRKYSYLLLPAGFFVENLDKGGLKRFEKCPCMIASLEVDDEDYNEMQKILNKMEEQSDIYRYNIIGLLLLMMHIEHKREVHKFCSEFVAECLDVCKNVELEKNTCMYEPMDLATIEGLEFIYKGTIKELSRDWDELFASDVPNK